MEKICPFCDKIFDQELIKDHIGIEHLGLETGAFQSTDVSESNTFDCKDCNEKFTSESDLKIHRNIVHPSFKFACEQCDKRFLSERSVNMHVKVVHSNQVEKQDSSKADFIVSVKQEILVQSPKQDRLNMDKETSENQQGYICKKCPKKFVDKSNLKRHVRSIHQGHRFKCKICS